MAANPTRLAVLFAAGVAVFVLLMAALERAGLPAAAIGYVFVIAPVAAYILIGLASRAGDVADYYVAGRAVPAITNGMAIAAQWISAATFIGLAGTLYFTGYDGLAFVLGWTGGYVLVAVLIAPYLRRFGQFTVPDFLAARFGGTGARLMGVAVVMLTAFAYLVAQIVGIGIIAARFLGIPFEAAALAGLAAILACSLSGGMRAVTWTQVAQYAVLAIAYLVPATWISLQVTGVPVPQLTYGQALEKVAALEQLLGVALSHLAPFAGADGKPDMAQAANFFGLAACLMLGTASLPHILMRFFTTPSVREARRSAGWALIFIVLLTATAPAYAAFAKLEVYQNVVGLAVEQMPQWVLAWGKAGLVGICDAAETTRQFALCGDMVGNGDGIVQLPEFRIHPDAVVLATPEIAGLPAVAGGLLAAGGLAAALSTADGLLLAIAAALSHDVHYGVLEPGASPRRRLASGRLAVAVMALAATAMAIWKPAAILPMVAWAFSIAASGLFSALVLGIWWKRATSAGAMAGMIAGLAVCAAYLIAVEGFGAPPWFGIRATACGVFGIPAAFLTTIAVSLLSPPPARESGDLLDFIRTPADEAPKPLPNTRRA